jgi:plastocyanin
MNTGQKSVASTTLLALLLAVAQQPVCAAAIEVVVLAPDGQPVPDVAVFVDQAGVVNSGSAKAVATMDQVNSQFVPHLLVVQTGTAVEFPNSDVVAHHVYSFSKPNNFVLPLYKGDAHAPIRLEHPGVVILGCNIHDSMLGYIVVVDTASFGTTDATGRIVLNVDAGAASYTVNIWSPRIRDAEDTLAKQVKLSIDGAGAARFELQKKLRPPHASQSSAVQWSDY